MNQKDETLWFSATVQADEGFTPSLVANDGSTVSSSKQLIKYQDSDFKLGVWRAPAGVYLHGGNETGETFVVIEGNAEIEIGDSGPIKLNPGTLIAIKPNTPSKMTVHSLLHKVSFNLA